MTEQLDQTLSPAGMTMAAAGSITQQEVYQLIAERGYHAGFSEDVFAARQIAKLAEELGELAAFFNLPDDLAGMMRVLRSDARHNFDCGTWKGAKLEQHYAERALQGLADLQIAIFVLAESVSRVSGRPFNVLGAAIQKAVSDVERAPVYRQRPDPAIEGLLAENILLKFDDKTTGCADDTACRVSAGTNGGDQGPAGE